MTFIESRHQDKIGEAEPSARPIEDDRDGWSSGELVRLFMAPVVVTVLLVGGVYWIRLQLPAGAVGQQQASVVQVHLLPRPDPVPIAVAAAAPSPTQNVASLADTSRKDPDPTPSEDPVAMPRTKAFLPAEAPPSNVTPAPSAVSGLSSSAALKFQQALLRHVKRQQRYPNVARPLHLKGTVDTQFAMSRDGTVLGVWVRTSSGQALLDNEAIETIRRAQPLPPIPPELPGRLNIHVQLEFDPS